MASVKKASENMQILVVEDEGIVADDIKQKLNKMGYKVPAMAASGEKAIDEAGRVKPDLVLMDVRLKGDMDGIEAAEKIRSFYDVPIIYLTGNADKTTIDRAKATLPHGYLVKPFNERELEVAIEMALHKHATEKIQRESRYRRIVENSIDITVRTDVKGNFTYFNPTATRLLGYTTIELMGRNYIDLIQPEYRNAAKEFFENQFANKILDTYYEFPAIAKDGSIVWLGQITHLEMEGDRVVGFHAVASDITKHKRAEVALRESEEHYRLLFERNLVGVYRSTLDGKLLDCNDAFAKIFGYESREEALENSARSVYFSLEDRAALINRLFLEGALKEVEVALRTKGGNPVWVIINESLIKTSDGSFILEGTIFDISKRKRAEAKLKIITEQLERANEELNKLATTDALTGLYNRRGFFTVAQQLLSAAQRIKKEYVLLFVDLDGLKQINDNFGHEEGDFAIAAAANILRDNFRASDIIARMGGDEFIILATVADSEHNQIITSRLQSKVKEYNERNNHGYKLSLSVGVKRFAPDKKQSLEDIVAEADKKMYEHKQSKRKAARE